MVDEYLNNNPGGKADNPEAKPLEDATRKPGNMTITGLASDVSFDTGCFGRREPRGKIYATNWLKDISTCADFPAVQVQFKNTRFGFYSNPSHLNLEIGDIVAVEASPGHDIGRVSMVGPLVRRQMTKAKVDPDNIEALKKVFRKASQTDIERFNEARKREHPTMIESRRIAENLGLNMKIGDVEYQGDGGKAIFYYIADERVDFRKLIRILADTFKVRIEMKQIGARQEAGRIGGIGPCGRPLCCSSWMTHFVSVGTGAARTQDISMSPQKLAGQCAKLKCCLNFEMPVYSEAVKQIPPKDAVLSTHDGDFFFFKSDILSRTITYSSDPKIAANLVAIPAARAFEIIALNKQGIKVDRLSEVDEEKNTQREYIDLTDQDSLTRFDKAKKKKKKSKSSQKQDKKESQKSDLPREFKSEFKDNKDSGKISRGDLIPGEKKQRLKLERQPQIKLDKKPSAEKHPSYPKPERRDASQRVRNDYHEPRRERTPKNYKRNGNRNRSENSKSEK